MQPVTLMFKVGGVEMDRAVLPGAFEDDREIPKGHIQQLGKKYLPHPAGHVLLYPSTLPGIVTVNMTNAIDIDGTRAEDLTRAEKICRSQLDPIVNFLREFIPGFEQCFLITSASIMGVRETRHLEGQYILTGEDILNARFFDDWIVARAHFNFDVHSIVGSGLDEKGVQRDFPQKKHYTIPYRCFVPKIVDNLFFAGRNISGSHIAHSNYRAMPICANMGYAIGIAAALCAKQKIGPRDLEPTKIQEILEEQGVSP